jgi:hypothetical protein
MNTQRNVEINKLETGRSGAISEEKNFMPLNNIYGK